MSKINLIVCTDSKGGISKNGKIPWKIDEDYNYFRDTITDKSNSNNPNIIIFGRNTYEQMGLVKGHINVIISKTIKNIETTETVYIYRTISGAMEEIKTLDFNKIFICGGKQIYNYFLENYKTDDYYIHWTLINFDYNCDNHINFDKLKEEWNTYRRPYRESITLNCEDKLNNCEVIVDFLFQRPYPYNNYIQEIKYIKQEQKYIDVMKDILTNGKYSKCRNGYTYSKFGEILKFTLDKFPLLTTKKMFIKGIFEELMYFIKGDTNSKHLYDKGVKIWEKNTTNEFIKKCNLPYEEFDMGPMYGFQWRHFNAEYKGMNESYSNKGFDQLQYVLNELKSNPSSRRILMTTYNPAQAREGVLFPCHGISIQFNTELINDNQYKLNISQNQRSCDYFLGVPFNIASYALLNYMICHVLNNDSECKYKYIPGELIMFLGDYHIYKEHIVQAHRQMFRTPKIFPTLKFKQNISNIEDFTFDCIELIDYDCYPAIQAEMIA
jgi:dihydrofolate reductase/thymidylate synthase